MLKTYIILDSCMIFWLSKAPKVILYLVVVKIYCMKLLNDLSTLVVYLQLEKGLKFNDILYLHHEIHPPPTLQKPTRNWWLK